MLELHYPTVTKTILERQCPGKPTLKVSKVAFGNDNSLRGRRLKGKGKGVLGARGKQANLSRQV